MKTRILVLALASLTALGAVLTGCSTRPADGQPESSSQVSQAEEPGSTVQPSQAEEPADTPAPEQEPASQPPVSSGEPAQAEIVGKLVMNDGSIFGWGEDALGTQADLDAWNAALSEQGTIAKLLVSTWNTERDLTQEEVDTVLTTLAALSPTVMEELGNPATGGATNIAALDQGGNRLWTATLNSNWLLVRIGDDTTAHILEIDEAGTAPIHNIAD